MKKLSVLLLMFMLISSLVVAGCGGSTKDGANDGSTTDKPGKVYVGFIGPLTGPAAYIGVDSLHGAKLAALEVNEQGGFEVNGKKYELEVVEYDDEMVAAKSVAGIQKLKDQYDLKLTVNNLSGTIMALLERNEELEVLITGFFRVPDATKVGNKLVLRFQNTNDDEAALLAKGAAEVFGAKTYAVVADSTDYGKALATAWEREFANLGVEQVGLEYVNQAKETDFRPQLTKIKAANPDVVMVATYDEAAAGSYLQARELGIQSKFTFSTGLQQMGQEMIGAEKLEGNGATLGYEIRTPIPVGTQHYQDLYEQKASELGWKEPRGSYGNNVYEQVWSMIYGMQEAGTVDDPYKIRETIPKIVPLPDEHSSAGMEGWTEDGNGILGQSFGVFRDGKIVEP